MLLSRLDVREPDDDAERTTKTYGARLFDVPSSFVSYVIVATRPEANSLILKFFFFYAER